MITILFIYLECKWTYRATHSRSTPLAACHYSFYGFCCWRSALNAASISQTKKKKKQMRKAAAEAESRKQKLAQLLCGFLVIHIYQTRTLWTSSNPLSSCAMLCSSLWQRPQPAAATEMPAAVAKTFQLKQSSQSRTVARRRVCRIFGRKTESKGSERSEKRKQNRIEAGNLQQD